jgi:hypothetical protein
MWQRFTDWLRPVKSPLWGWEYTSPREWMLTCNEGNCPNITIRPGFFYVAVWLFRPFRWHWKAHWFAEKQKMSERIEELEEELQQLKARYIEELDGDSFLRKWLTSERGVPFLATHDD